MPKRKNKRGPYRCAKCREYGHRADKCKRAHKFTVILDSMPGAEALARLIPESVQILTVLEGEAGNALVGAVRGNELLAARGIPHNDSLINAWKTLNGRAAKIQPHQLLAAREARKALAEAEAAYQRAIAPVRAALGLAAPEKRRQT